jgi:hypothetical protein
MSNGPFHALRAGEINVVGCARAVEPVAGWSSVGWPANYVNDFGSDA